jgi:transcriptional regulator with XRE-family HTH domain
MGSVARQRSKRLAEKLLQIRTALGLSQNSMIRHLGLTEEMFQARISSYELGTREPPLPVLLAYARAANIYVDALIDDELDLPLKLPIAKKSEGVKRASASRRRKTINQK